MRRKSREIALQTLYQIELTGAEPGQAFALAAAHYHDTGKDAPALPYARELVEGVHGELAGLDRLIGRFARHWRLERMSVVDRSILRMAAFEIRHRPEVPARVVINEAIELAKLYGTEESGPFVNGILDAIRVHASSEPAAHGG
ncbi:MAG: transcription antitermination factor NusB [Thermodesulfobacteriota bacterium]